MSFTDYNNSDTKYSLIKLVEADGGNTKNTQQNNGLWASEKDLWKTNAVLKGYSSNNGTKCGYIITFTSVTKTSVTVTVEAA